MSFAPEVSVRFRHMERSDELVELAKQEVQTLFRRHPHIINCAVVVEKVQSRHHCGNPIRVRVCLGVPGKVIVVAKSGEDPDETVGASTALFQAFHAAEHAVANYKNRQEARRHGEQWANFFAWSDHGVMP